MLQDLKGSSTTQIQEQVGKLRELHTDIAKCPLPRHFRWIGLKQSIWKSIEYVLPATTFTRAEAANLNYITHSYPNLDATKTSNSYYDAITRFYLDYAYMTPSSSKTHVK